jgi:arylsulfatase A-like enzyme
MNRTIKVFLAVISVLLFNMQSEAKMNKKPLQKPNIIYLLADDLGIGDLGCYNPGSKIPTPFIDALAHSGMMFMDAHTGSAVCTPTRYGILTGKYAFRTRLKSGVLWGSSPVLIEPGTETVATMLKKYNYNTACIGKWHLGMNWQTIEPGLKLSDNWQADIPKIDFTKPILAGPNEAGFDYFFGIPASLDMPPYLYIENNLPQGIPSVLTKEGGREGLTVPGFKARNVMPDLTRKTIHFIMQQSPEKPFFLYFPWTAPHTPIVPNNEFSGKSQSGGYGDFVVECDHTVNEIIKTLKEKNLYENTIIILTSDNGSSPHGFPLTDEIKFSHNTSNGFKGRKSHSYEGGHRVPFIVSWPKYVKNNTKSDEVICSTDLFATLSEILNRPLNTGEAPDSYSFLPVLTGRKYKKPLREATIHHSLHGDFSIRKGTWKYIDAKGHGGFAEIKELVPTDAVQLYNLKNDPAETNNIAGKFPEKVNDLKNLLEQYKTQGFSRHKVKSYNCSK